MTSSPKPPLWPHQERAIASDKPKQALFFDPRTGKTRTAIDLLEKWQAEDGFERGLIGCPLAVCEMWANLLESTRKFTVVRAYAVQVKNLGAVLAHAYGLQKPPIVVVMNYDKATPAKALLGLYKPDAVICDESHYLKSHESGRGKTMRPLCWGAKYVRILSGTPAPNHYGDLWGQMSCVNKAAYGTWSAFRNRYLITDPIYPSRVLGHMNEAELQDLLLDDAIFVRREDVFGPDTYQAITRTLRLPGRARRLYDNLVNDWLTAEPDVTADHVLKRLMRLQQLTSGYLPGDDGETNAIHSVKVDAVMADLSEIVASREKAVIFHRFQWEADVYEAACKREFPKCPVFRIDGARHDDYQDFQRTKGAAIMIAQTQAGGIGIDLSEATHGLFVSRSFSFSEDKQAQDRIYKQGKNRCLTYYVCEDTVDEYIAEVIDTKSNIHDAVTHADIGSMAYGSLHKRSFAA